MAAEGKKTLFVAAAILPEDEKTLGRGFAINLFFKQSNEIFHHFLAFLNITLYLSLSSAAISQVIKTRANIILRS